MFWLIVLLFVGLLWWLRLVLVSVIWFIYGSDLLSGLCYVIVFRIDLKFVVRAICLALWIGFCGFVLPMLGALEFGL